ncbi:MAG: glycosyltransferase family 4 protein [Micrococcaceae bacterium]
MGYNRATSRKIVLIRSNNIYADSRVEKEIKSLVSAGYEVEIIGWSRDNDKLLSPETYLTYNNKKIKVHFAQIPAPMGGGKKNLIALAKFQKYIYSKLEKISDIDAIHACDFNTGFAAFLYSKKNKIPLVYDIFDYYTEAYPVPSILIPVIKTMENTIINNANTVILVKENRLEQIKGTKPKKVEIIHNSPEGVAIGNSKTTLDPNCINFVFIGALNEHRFIEEILDLVSHTPEWRIVFGGDGNLVKKIKHYESRHSNVEYIGTMPYVEVLEREKNADIMFAMYDPQIPNHKYSAPNKFYEALMLGKPIIVANDTGIDQDVIKNSAGITSDYNTESFKEAVNNMFDIDLVELSKHSNKVFNEKYSWTIMEKKLLSIYNDIFKD